MLAAIMYHHAGADKYSNSPELLDRQFAYIRKRRITTVFPGDDVSRGNHLCLVFDDAYYDFYHYVFPLLKKHHLRAVLAVPTGFILEDTDLPAETRLSLPHDLMMKEQYYKTHAPFCTWRELSELVASGHVHLAAHGCRHDTQLPERDYILDLVESQKALSSHHFAGVKTLVFPGGRLPRLTIPGLLWPQLSYLFGIGGCKYEKWGNTVTPLERYPGDCQADSHALIDCLFTRHSLRWHIGRYVKAAKEKMWACV